MKPGCIVFAAALCCIFSCTYSPASNPQTGLNGTWKWNATIGGIGGWTYTPATEGFSCTVLFSNQSDYSLFRNDTLKRSGVYTLSSSNGISHLSIPIGDDSSFNYRILFDGAMRISHDTMMLSMDSVNDGFSSYFIRQ